MVLSFGVVEFGSLIQAQAVVTNVTREGGSLASRDLKNGSDLLDLLEASSWPLNFSCPVEDTNCVPSEQVERFKIYVTKIDAGTSGSTRPRPVPFRKVATFRDWDHDAFRGCQLWFDQHVVGYVEA